MPRIRNNNIRDNFKNQGKIIVLAGVILCLVTATLVYCLLFTTRANLPLKPEIFQQELDSNIISEDILINNEINWVLNNNQADSGVITMNGKHQGAWIVPYQSSYFGIHALKVKPSIFPQIKKYILWHFDHINTQPDPDGLTGTIFDYNVSGSDVIPTYIYTPESKLYDSVDSYASVFFSLLKTYWDTTHDSQLLIDNKDKIELILGALMAVMETNNLTRGTATWPLQYTPDNFEVNIGLYDLEYLYRNVFHDNSKADYIKGIADKNKTAIEQNLWSNSVYLVYRQQKFSDFNWLTLYGDAFTQIWGITTGYLSSDSSRSKTLYNQFNIYQPNWTSANGDNNFPFGKMIRSVDLPSICLIV